MINYMNQEFVVDELLDDEAKHYAIRPNKTQIKKDIHALFKLAEEMSLLSTEHLDSLQLPEKIHHAVVDVSKMGLTGARKRLLKHIAGLLHKTDVTPFVEKLARMKNKSAHAVREHHMAERWRERLLHEGNDALTDFLYEFPEADAQQIRQLIRNAQKEKERNNPPKAARQLYQVLKGLITSDIQWPDEEILAHQEDVAMDESDEEELD